MPAPSAGDVISSLHLGHELGLVRDGCQHVVANVVDLHALRGKLLGHVGVARAEHDALAVLLRGSDDLVGGLDHLGVLVQVGDPQGSGEVVGSQDEAVEARDRRDLLEVLHGLCSLDHHTHEDVLVGCLQVGGYGDAAVVHGDRRPEAPAEAVRHLHGAGLGRVEGGRAEAPLRIAAVGDDAAHLLRRADLGHRDAVRVGVKGVLDEHAPGQPHAVDAVRARDPHQAGAALAVRHDHVHLQLGGAHGDVLQVEPEEVDAVGEAVRGDGVRQLDADADEGLPPLQLGPELPQGLELLAAPAVGAERLALQRGAGAAPPARIRRALVSRWREQRWRRDRSKSHGDRGGRKPANPAQRPPRGHLP
mmetsp:Transcript_30256/g.89691  ORF Transcript_30256/g.89691 Transcript_30256/m.89691 type:complete len:362 (+) Transcript_30256:134-1219(+)